MSAVGAFNFTRTNHTLVCLPDPFQEESGEHKPLLVMHASCLVFRYIGDRCYFHIRISCASSAVLNRCRILGVSGGCVWNTGHTGCGCSHCPLFWPHQAPASPSRNHAHSRAASRPAISQRAQFSARQPLPLPQQRCSTCPLAGVCYGVEQHCTRRLLGACINPASIFGSTYCLCWETHPNCMQS